MKRYVASLVLVCLSAVAAHGDVSVPRIFSNNMILQRDIPATVWGKADPGEKVTVKIGGHEAKTEADGKGDWRLKLPPMPVNTKPQELTIEGKNTLKLKNVLLGDVWLCSGQSNMFYTFEAIGASAKEDIASANYPNIRRIQAFMYAYEEPSDEVQVTNDWEVCSPKTIPQFTAVGYYFARRVNQETGVPIGLLSASRGSTAIEPWLSPTGIAMEKSLSGLPDEARKMMKDYRNELSKKLDETEKWIAEARQAMGRPNVPLPPQPVLPSGPLFNGISPLGFYNGMIHPFTPFAIKGVLWYQGEANGEHSEKDEYYTKMRALIGGWRKDWGQGDFPFYFVQIANWGQPNEDPAGNDLWSGVRAAQTKTMQNLPHTGMAVAIDTGDAREIHPSNKFDVGERLARWALRNEYGQKDLVVSGPIFKSMTIEGDKARIKFDSIGSGLIVGKKEGRKPTEEDKQGKLKQFAVAGEDKKWVWADVVIDGETVVVSSPQVSKPVAVRYAYSRNPQGCNLYNKEGLPASPFRTDDW